MAVISKILVPPGGWIYEEGGIQIFGSDFDDLVRTVQNHRRSNGKNPEGAESDVMNYFAKKFPHLVIMK